MWLGLALLLLLASATRTSANAATSKSGRPAGAKLPAPADASGILISMRDAWAHLGDDAAAAAARRPPPPPPRPFTLHPILGDNAVLQRAPARAAIYGWAQEAGATITVHFRGKSYEGTVAANDTSLGALMWRVELPPTPASTVPENITVTGLGATATLGSVLFGDVWMCGGQSNMEVPLDETFEWFHPDVSNDTEYPIRVMVFPHVNGLNDSTIHVFDDSPIPWLNATYENLTGTLPPIPPP